MNYNDYRRKSRKIDVGGIAIGGDAKISVQSMTNTDTHNVEATYLQVKKLAEAGCDIVRITAPDEESVKTFKELKQRGIVVPLVADIHFNHKIAIMAAEAGVDKIRINPGNIGSKANVREVVKACTEYGVPIRIGVNGGSLEKEILAKYGSPTAEALAESAMFHAGLLEKYDFDDIVLSLKSSNTQRMYDAYVLAAEKCRYPLHLGVTEAGTERMGVIKSAAGIGGLLLRGIGATVRVSLTDDPVLEIKAAKDMLKALGLRDGGIKFVSCPTCGRTKIDLIELSNRFKKAIQGLDTQGKDIKVALMGCVVNGPGEARECDIGIAGGKGEAVLFRRGDILGKISEDDVISVLVEEIKKIIVEK